MRAVCTLDLHRWNSVRNSTFRTRTVNLTTLKEEVVGKGILLWLLGIPLPIILLLLLFWH
ncbi:MAG: hypothetical protein QOH86_1675 [Sphingomonadales bacterium]|jgi:hypothetical protein|nr:hypothetical protein [Sphingomonadales bacterium]